MVSNFLVNGSISVIRFKPGRGKRKLRKGYYCIPLKKGKRASNLVTFKKTSFFFLIAVKEKTS